MFTGLIEAIGTIDHLQPAQSGCVLGIRTPLCEELQPGDSIAVNGVCLTVTSRDHLGFEAEISPETLRVSTLGRFDPGRVVNLERPLRATDRLGGHFVLGHVDGVGAIRSLEPDGDCFWLDVETPRELGPYVIPKGSIAIDGISLTIAALRPDGVRVQIIPFTWGHTALRYGRAGDGVNIEADVIGKYVARLLGGQAIAGEVPVLSADRS